MVTGDSGDAPGPTTKPHEAEEKAVRPVRVLLVSSHPAQYAPPTYRLYEQDPCLDVTVAYCSMHGSERAMDPEFGIEVAWDVPLLEGYRWVSPPNRSPSPGIHRFFGLINPGLWPLIRKGSYELVICYGYRALSFWIAIAAAKVSRSRLVLTSDAPTLERPGMPRFKVFLKRALLPRIFGLADGVLAPSTRAARLFALLGTSESRIFLTPFVVDVSRFAAPQPDARKKVRDELGIDDDQLCLVFVGKLIERKRPYDLIEALKHVPDVHAIICGDGPLRPSLASLAAAIADRVHFRGFVNQAELPGVYAAADALVVCSDYEPFAVVVNEAMAQGRPVIASEAVGAVGDLVLDGSTGLTFRVGDIAGLAAQIRLIADRRDLLVEMGAKAWSRILEWGPKQNAEAFRRACLSLARDVR